MVSQLYAIPANGQDQTLEFTSSVYISHINALYSSKYYLIYSFKMQNHEVSAFETYYHHFPLFIRLVFAPFPVNRPRLLFFP